MNSNLEHALEIIKKDAGLESDRGVKAELARRLGITPAYLHKILRTGHVPAEQCKKFETVTGGAVTASHLRPDIFGALDDVA